MYFLLTSDLKGSFIYLLLSFIYLPRPNYALQCTDHLCRNKRRNKRDKSFQFSTRNIGLLDNCASSNILRTAANIQDARQQATSVRSDE